MRGAKFHFARACARAASAFQLGTGTNSWARHSIPSMGMLLLLLSLLLCVRRVLVPVLLRCTVLLLVVLLELLPPPSLAME